MKIAALLLALSSRSREPGGAASVLCAQVWAWCGFFWFFDDGRYRPKLLDYAKREFRGESGPAVFREAWGAPIDEGVAREFEERVRSLFAQQDR